MHWSTTTRKQMRASMNVEETLRAGGEEISLVGQNEIFLSGYLSVNEYISWSGVCFGSVLLPTMTWRVLKGRWKMGPCALRYCDKQFNGTNEAMCTSKNAVMWNDSPRYWEKILWEERNPVPILDWILHTLLGARTSLDTASRVSAQTKPWNQSQWSGIIVEWEMGIHTGVEASGERGGTWRKEVFDLLYQECRVHGPVECGSTTVIKILGRWLSDCYMQAKIWGNSYC